MLEHSSEPDLSHMSPGPFVQSPLPKTPVAVRLNSAEKCGQNIAGAIENTIFPAPYCGSRSIHNRYKSNPDPASWGRIAKEISELLDIPKNSRSGVIANIKTVAKLGGDLSQFNVNAGTSQRRKGRFLIKDGSPEAGVLIRGLESGLLKNGALSWVNYLRHDLGEPPVSRFAVTMFIARYQSKQVMKRLRRGKTKSGSTQPDSDWAQARLCFVDQLLSAFANGELAIEQVVFADEHHQNCQLGAFSEYETVVCRNSHGDIVPESEGGIWPERHPTVTSKNTTTTSTAGTQGGGLWVEQDAAQATPAVMVASAATTETPAATAATNAAGATAATKHSANSRAATQHKFSPAGGVD